MEDLIKLKSKIDELKYYPLTYSFVFISFIIALWFTNDIKYKKAERGITEYRVSFMNKSSKIQSTNSMVFIGQTKEYIFMKDLKKNEIEINKKSDIEEFKLLLCPIK